MPLVVVDTSVALPATLSATGLTRKFFVLLAYGGTAYEVEHGRLELDELTKEAEASGGRVRGLEHAENLRGRAADRRAALEELLPHGTPDDWVAVGSAALFDEYERKLREIGSRLNPALRDEDIPRLRHQVEAICAAGSPPFDPKHAPALTRDPNDDAIVYTALLGDPQLRPASERCPPDFPSPRNPLRTRLAPQSILCLQSAVPRRVARVSAYVRSQARIVGRRANSN